MTEKEKASSREGMGLPGCCPEQMDNWGLKTREKGTNSQRLSGPRGEMGGERGEKKKISAEWNAEKKADT